MSDKILNPKTGKWVLKTGKIGKLLLQTTKTKEGGTSSTKGTKTCNPEVAKYKFNPNLYICNPLTGNWVLKSGDIGKLLIGGGAPYPTPGGYPSGTAQKGKSPKGKLPKSKSPKGKSPKGKLPKSKSPKGKSSLNQKSPCDPKNPKAQNSKYICNPASGIWVMKTSAIGKKLLNTINPDMILNPSTGKYVLKYGAIGKKILKDGDNKLKSPSKNNSFKPKSPKKIVYKKPVQYKTSNTSIAVIKNAPAKVLLPNKVCDVNNKTYKSNPDDYVCNPFTGNWIPKNSTKGKEMMKIKGKQVLYNAVTHKIINKNDHLYKVLLDTIKSKSPELKQLSPVPHQFHPQSAIFCNPGKYGLVFKKQLHYVANLDKKYLDVLKYYTGSGFININYCLRGIKECSEGVKKYINMLDEIFNNIPPLEKDVILWRNYGFFKIKQFKTHVEPAYSSTTAIKYSHQVNHPNYNYIEIRVPKGSKVIPLISCSQYVNEIEVLLPRNTQYNCVQKSIYSTKELPVTKMI